MARFLSPRRRRLARYRRRKAGNLVVAWRAYHRRHSRIWRNAGRSVMAASRVGVADFIRLPLALNIMCGGASRTG